MPGRVILRNYEGFLSAYTEPQHAEADEDKYSSLCAPERKSCEGVMALLRGKKVSLGPAETKRNLRRKH